VRAGRLERDDALRRGETDHGLIGMADKLGYGEREREEKGGVYLVGDVVDDERGLGAAVIHGREGVETLLAS
jgi:hypothetical protein